jgi:hypothetical protein
VSDQRGQWGAPGRQPQRQPPSHQQWPGYAADPYGGAYGEYGVHGAYAGAPYGGGAGPRSTNGAALAGAILSVLPPLGIVLSAVGLSRAKALGGAGRTAASIGIALSLVFAGGYGFGIYELASSADADPACASVSATEAQLSTDESALATVESSGGDSDAQAALGTVVAELQPLKLQLSEDAMRATQANVRSRIQAVESDLGKMIVDLKAVQGGDDSALSALDGAASQLQTDSAAMNSVCGLAG